MIAELILNGDNVAAIIGGIIALAVAAVTSVASIVSALASRNASSQAREINDAVNHKHRDTPRLYDQVLSQGTAINTLRDKIAGLEVTMARTEQLITDHDLWERTQDGSGSRIGQTLTDKPED